MYDHPHSGFVDCLGDSCHSCLVFKLAEVYFIESTSSLQGFLTFFGYGDNLFCYRELICETVDKIETSPGIILLKFWESFQVDSEGLHVSIQC